MNAEKIEIQAFYRGTKIGSAIAPQTEGSFVQIGRDEGNDLVIPGSFQYVGRHHCTMQFYHGQWYIKNYSSNGSYVGGKPADEPLPLNGPVTLLSGEYTIQLRLAPVSGTAQSPGTVRSTDAARNAGMLRDKTCIQPEEDKSVEILLVDENENVQNVPLTFHNGSVYRFGSDANNKIVIRSAYAAAQHGEIIVKNGLWYLAVTEGKTLQVNGSCTIRQGERVRVSAGDVIKIGGERGILMVLVEPGGKWLRHKLPVDREFVIGRSEVCDIRLKHVGVSRRHAVIRFDRVTGRFTIENYGMNGSMLDGRILERRQQMYNHSTVSITHYNFILSGDELLQRVEKVGMRIEARALSRDVKNHGETKRILNDVNLSIEPGEFVAIIGGSGCGKSTLLNALTGYERATEGAALVGGLPLYENYDYFKNIMGFVPQQDIVYDHLRLDKMLEYTAQLRMPKDSSLQERLAHVQEVLEMVELTEFSTSMVKKLSGGQRKRASIAVELLADPDLFFLDEPTSGLDPGTERNLMHTLRKLSTTKSKTVIMVTHTTLNLQLCDKIIVMGKGGRLCYCGRPEDALAFFGVDDFVDIYELVANDAEYWCSRASHTAYSSRREDAENAEVGKVVKPSFLSQTSILARRYLNIICNDRARLLLMLVEPIVMGLILFVCKPENAFESYIDTKNILFTYVCCAIWTGIFNSVQEICKERVILKREYMTNLHLSSYIVSKLEIQALLCFVQSVLLFGVFALLVGYPDEGILLESALPEMFLTTFLTILSSSGIGLCLSAVAKDPDKAMTLSPFLLVVQLVFAGIIFALDGAAEILSKFTISRWSMSALGISADLEGMYIGLGEFNDMFEHEIANLYMAWGVLAAFCVVSCLLAMLMLRNVSKDSR